jgi:hypothetical protein
MRLSGGLSIAALLLSGCASGTFSSLMPGAPAPAEEETAAAGEPVIVEMTAGQSARIEALERQLAETEAELEAARAASESPAAGSDFMPRAEPGTCFARVTIPAEFRSVTEDVEVRAAAESVEIIPARYETVREQVLVKEAETRLEVIPATYETVEERVLISPASTRIEEIPAVYETVTERIETSPARTEWKIGPASSFAAGSVVDTRADESGQLMCLVEIPATYETVSKRVITQPAKTREVTVPAEYKVFEKRVVATPATTREVVIPAEYATVEMVKLIEPAAERRVTVPAEYKAVTKRQKIRDERIEWREVVCEVNLTRDNVRLLQSALREAGSYGGSIDGILGPQTFQAANSYARKKGLPAGQNYIVMDVIDELGLDL